MQGLLQQLLILRIAIFWRSSRALECGSVWNLDCFRWLSTSLVDLPAEEVPTGRLERT